MKKIQDLDNLITEYIVANNEKFKGEKGDQGVPGEKGETGATGPAGTTDYNQLQNKPNLDNFITKNSTLELSDANIAIKLISKNNQAQYEEWVKNNVRKVIYGFESSSSNDKFVFNGFTHFSARLPYVEFGQKLKMGHGGSDVFFTPEDNTIKTLKFYDGSVGSNCLFNLDFGGKSKVMGLQEPDAPQQPTTKNYVDNKYDELLRRIEALETKK